MRSLKDTKTLRYPTIMNKNFGYWSRPEWKAHNIRTECTFLAGGWEELLPKMAKPGPRRGVNPAEGLVSVLASASTYDRMSNEQDHTQFTSICQGLHMQRELSGEDSIDCSSMSQYYSLKACCSHTCKGKYLELADAAILAKDDDIVDTALANLTQINVLVDCEGVDTDE